MGRLGAVKREMLSLLEFVFVLAELTEVPLAMGAAEGIMCMKREEKIRRRGRVLSDGMLVNFL